MGKSVRDKKKSATSPLASKKDLLKKEQENICDNEIEQSDEEHIVPGKENKPRNERKRKKKRRNDTEDMGLDSIQDDDHDDITKKQKLEKKTKKSFISSGSFLHGMNVNNAVALTGTDTMVKQIEKVIQQCGFSLSSFSTGREESEASTWKRKYQELYELRETDAEMLLDQHQKLSKEEVAEYKAMMEDLKKEIHELKKKIGVKDDQSQSIKELSDIKEEYERVMKSNRNLKEKNSILEEKLKESEQEAQTLREKIDDFQNVGKTSAAQASAAASSLTDLNLKISQMAKLLGVYQMLTNTKITLMEDEDPDTEGDPITEVSCELQGKVPGQVYEFDLAIPHNEKEEVDCVPNGDWTNAPSFLQDEFSFGRQEFPKFFYTILGMIVNQKN